jgi:hypothetical protein
MSWLVQYMIVTSAHAAITRKRGRRPPGATSARHHARTRIAGDKRAISGPFDRCSVARARNKDRKLLISARQ